ncbi:transposase [Streptomyces sp. GD-15H]|uniref:transposase n=1 Tax=Streptomyces sp. GD-15H TaxID=3129112 RepID=UPI003873C5AA
MLALIPREDQRAMGDCYLRGLMMDGRRKSIQAMVSRLPDGNEQNLQQFVNQSIWDPVPVRRRIAERLVPLIGPDAWAVETCRFPRTAGCRSVSPTSIALGKQANCQVAVSVLAPRRRGGRQPRAGHRGRPRALSPRPWTRAGALNDGSGLKWGSGGWGTGKGLGEGPGGGSGTGRGVGGPGAGSGRPGGPGCGRGGTGSGGSTTIASSRLEAEGTRR